MGLETQDFKWDPRPKTWDPSHRRNPGLETPDPKGGTQDPRPETQLIGGTRDPILGTLKVGSGTRDPGP